MTSDRYERYDYAARCACHAMLRVCCHATCFRACRCHMVAMPRRHYAAIRRATVLARLWSLRLMPYALMATPLLQPLRRFRS